MIINNNETNNQDCQLNLFRRVLKRLIAPWAWNFEEERIPLDKFPDLSLLISIGNNKHWMINGVDTGIIAEGRRGLSAYEVAVALGFSGTETEWLESLKGEKGDNGLLGLRGPAGITGATGEQGLRGLKGDTPTIIDGMWHISGINTGILAEGKDGKDGLRGEKGDNGQAQFKSIVFIRTNNLIPPSAPTGGNFNSPYPTSVVRDTASNSDLLWLDGIPAGQARLYSTTRIFTSDGLSPQQIAWTTPQPMTDTQTYDVEFSDVDSNPGNPTNNPGNWFDPVTNFATKDFTQMLWRAERKCVNGVWSNWTIVRIKGETGNDAILNAQQLQLLNSVSSDLGNVNSKLGEIATYGSNNNITGITLYLATKIEDTIAGLATLTAVTAGGGHNILQTLFAKVGDGPDSTMASLILEVNNAGASISGIAQLGLFIGSISAKADASGVLSALLAVANNDGNVTVASIIAKINESNTSIEATANNFRIVDNLGNPTFRIDNGNIVAYGNATFTGKIVANSLILGSGVTIPQSGVEDLSTDLSNKANNSEVLKKGVALGTLPASGATTSSSTGFQVDLNGLLTASNAVIYGTVYATNGSFSGRIDSTSGTIGGWGINNNTLYKSSEDALGDAHNVEISSSGSITLQRVHNLEVDELSLNTYGLSTHKYLGSAGNLTNSINIDGSGRLALGNITWETSGEGTLAGWNFDSTKLSSEFSETVGSTTFIYNLELDSSTPHIKVTKSLGNTTYAIILDGWGFRAQQLVNNSVVYTSYNLGISGGGQIANGGIEWADGGGALTFTTSPTFEEKIVISTDSDGEGISFNQGFICASGLYNGDTHDENMHFGSFSGEFYFHNTDSSGSTGSTTTLYASNFSQTSDIRLKENILDFFISAETLAQMPSVLFNFKSNKDIRQAGTIAQDWLKVLPEVVRENRDGTLSMNYTNASMVGVISMAKEIVKLKEEIKELKEAVNL